MIRKGGKYGALIDALRKIGRCTVAYSGGVDSTFLLAAAKRALGENVMAVTVDMPHVPRRQGESALRLARDLGVEHVVLTLPLVDEIMENPEDRCYLCKSFIFPRIRKASQDRGFEHVVEGTNADDPGEYRPGMKALEGSKILSPLRVCGFTKEDIRRESRRLHLPTWDKPACTCLLTRFPYNTPVTVKDLDRVEASEHYLESVGFAGIRVRVHGDIARIEVSPGQKKKFFSEALTDDIANKIKGFGFSYVCLDIEGYRPGRFDESILKRKKAR